MAEMAQSDRWLDLTSTIKIEDLILQAENPDEFQLELKRIIDAHSSENCRILEAGSFTGITSLSLDKCFKKTLLDLNPEAVRLSEKVFSHYGEGASFVVGDMFDMPFDDSSFDIVFNAGVLEHFDFEDRVRALKEYARVLTPGGILIIGFPNHYSTPYRFVYDYLNKMGSWQYPLENKLFDLQDEAAAAGLNIETRIVAAERTAYGYLAYLPKLRRYLSKIFFALSRYEGYLTVVKIVKG